MHTHLKMDGSWRISPAAGYPLRDHRIRLILANEQWQAVGFQLGIVELIRTSQEDRAVGHLGPDLLGPDWDVGRGRSQARRRARTAPSARRCSTSATWPGSARSTGPRRCSCAACQPVAAGRRRAPTCPALVEMARRLLDANKARGETGHDRQRGPRRPALGLRPGRPAVPPVRHDHQARQHRAGDRGADRLLVPALPAAPA